MSSKSRGQQNQGSFDDSLPKLKLDLSNLQNQLDQNLFEEQRLRQENEALKKRIEELERENTALKQQLKETNLPISPKNIPKLPEGQLPPLIPKQGILKPDIFKFEVLNENSQEFQELKKKLLGNQSPKTPKKLPIPENMEQLQKEGLMPNQPSETSEMISLFTSHYHQEIVEKFIEIYRYSQGDFKKRLFEYSDLMANKGSINQEENLNIKATIEISLTLSEDTYEVTFDEQLEVSRKGIADIDDKVKNNPNSSLPAKVITGVVRESENEFRKKRSELATSSKMSPKQLWRKLVLEDLDGALQGGAAAATIAPAFSLSLPVVTALGALVGAGIKSGTAYGEVVEQQ